MNNVSRERDARTVRALLTDPLRHRANGDDGLLYQVSNPCWYRYEVRSLLEWTTATPGQPPPGTVEAQVKVYTHFWAGDVAGGSPRSFTQRLTLVDTSQGWRVSDVTKPERLEEEPNEPHGPTTSACNVGRRPVAWLISANLPVTGGLSPTLVSAPGMLLLGLGFVLRRRFCESQRRWRN